VPFRTNGLYQSSDWPSDTGPVAAADHDLFEAVKALVGSIRRECLDHVLVFSERHLRHLLRAYADYYNRTRAHLSLEKDSPASRPIEPFGRIVPMPILGGLHHQYVRI
jgi:hypothetical protein